MDVCIRPQRWYPVAGSSNAVCPLTFILAGPAEIMASQFRRRLQKIREQYVLLVLCFCQELVQRVKLLKVYCSRVVLVVDSALDIAYVHLFHTLIGTLKKTNTSHCPYGKGLR